MYVPVFRKTVTFTNLSSIAVAIGSIVSFDKSSVNHLANRRCLYRSFHFGFAAKDSPQINLYYSTFPAYLVNGGIFQTFCYATPSISWAAETNIENLPGEGQEALKRKFRSLTLEQARPVSPYVNASPDTAPMLLIHGTEDRSVDPKNSQELYDKFKEHGVTAELRWLEGEPHVFYVCAEAAGWAADWFDKHLMHSK